MGEVFRIGEPTVCGESSVASLEAPKALSAPSPVGALVLAVELVTPLIMSIAPCVNELGSVPGDDPPSAEPDVFAPELPGTGGAGVLFASTGVAIPRPPALGANADGVTCWKDAALGETPPLPCSREGGAADPFGLSPEAGAEGTERPPADSLEFPPGDFEFIEAELPPVAPPPPNEGGLG